MDDRNIKNIAVGVITLILIVAVFWFWRQSKNVAPEQKPTLEKPASIGAQIFEQAQNPTKDKLPEINPFAADTNPFSANTNPFKDIYKNPFGK